MRLSYSKILGLIAVLATRTAGAEPDRQYSALMEQKLTSAQNVLEGVATEDFSLIQAHAARLHLLSQEAGWNVLQTGQYVRFSDTFRNAAKELEESAKEKNLDAAGLAYIKLTISCIDCHRHIRTERTGKKPATPRGGDTERRP